MELSGLWVVMLALVLEVSLGTEAEQLEQWELVVLLLLLSFQCEIWRMRF